MIIIISPSLRVHSIFTYPKHAWNATSLTFQQLLSSNYWMFDEKRARGICFLYDERYSSRHKCKKKQILVLQPQVETGEEEEGESTGKDEELDNYNVMQLAFHAPLGTRGIRTMRLNGMCGRKRVCILVESRSTHNFLREQTALIGRNYNANPCVKDRRLQYKGRPSILMLTPCP